MLGELVAAARTRAAGLEGQRDALEQGAAAAPPTRDLVTALSKPGLSVIAEVKRRSPSAGAIAPDLDPRALAVEYAGGGAAAVSVLTEPDHFGGSLDDLTAVHAAVAVPVLRKDFIVDALQLFEARVIGADAVLLIAAALSAGELTSLVAAAADVGLDALVEAHDRGEVDRAIDAGASVVGINNRDLHTFEVDLGTAERLRSSIPSGVIAVAESGVKSAAEARRMHEAGFDAVLVGQAAAEAADPGAFVASLVAAS